jgi:hypothetical protein
MQHHRGGPGTPFSLPSASLLAVFSSSTGPAPQIQPPAVGAEGEKKKLCVVSPRPDSSLPPGTGDCASM